MLGTIKLNIIKNKLNDFRLKACVYIAPNELSFDKDNNKLQFSPRYYSDNKSPFYIVCSSKRSGCYNLYNYSAFNINKISTGTRNALLQACDNGKNNALKICNLDLERFLVMQQNKDFLGWYPSDDLIDENINVLMGNRYCKHHKDKFYYGDNKYEVDVSKLHLFVRIIPKDCNNLTNLLINCDRDNIYNISERGDVDKLGSLGFIIKLDDRYKYIYSKTYDKVVRIKYPFLTKERINNLLFSDYEAEYSINKEIIYIEDNTKLDEYKIKLLDGF